MTVTPIIMPRQGQSVESCVITKWHKSPGDAVAPGDILFSYETDKSAFDEEAKEAGTLLKILRGEGDDVPCLETVAVIGEPGEDYTKLAPEATAATSAAAGPEMSPQDLPFGPLLTRAAPAQATDHEKVSPRARALAAKSGADISTAAASGPEGRVIARDVQAVIDAGRVVTPAARGLVAEGVPGTGLGGRAALRDVGAEAPKTQAAPVKAPAPAETEPAAAFTDEPLSNIRKRIAKAMHESLSTMAQLTHTETYDATQVLALRKLFKDSGAAYGMQGVTIGDLVVFAVTRTLTQPEHAALNAHFLGDSMRYFRDVHLGIAVDTKRGLMVPVLRDANKKSLLEISNETKALAAACQSGAIDPDLLSGGSFTVSNLGAFEVEHFTPIINPPQTGVLGVNTIQQRVRETDGKIEVYNAMSISLTYDHRALDGAPASRFLRDLKRNLENIQMLLGGGAFHV